MNYKNYAQAHAAAQKVHLGGRYVMDIAILHSVLLRPCILIYARPFALTKPNPHQTA